MPDMFIESRPMAIVCSLYVFDHYSCLMRVMDKPLSATLFDMISIKREKEIHETLPLHADGNGNNPLK